MYWFDLSTIGNKETKAKTTQTPVNQKFGFQQLHVRINQQKIKVKLAIIYIITISISKLMEHVIPEISSNQTCLPLYALCILYIFNTHAHKFYVQILCS